MKEAEGEKKGSKETNKMESHKILCRIEARKSNFDNFLKVVVIVVVFSALLHLNFSYSTFFTSLWWLWSHHIWLNSTRLCVLFLLSPSYVTHNAILWAGGRYTLGGWEDEMTGTLKTPEQK